MVSNIQARFGEAALEVVQGDITKQEVDVIVNAANRHLRGGGGVDGAIHRAGGPLLSLECGWHAGCFPGKVVPTCAGNLKAKRVYHAVGPIWRGGENGEANLLASCYLEALALAEREGHSSIAFPSISTGAYRYPVKQAASVAMEIVARFLASAQSARLVRFVLFDEKTFAAYAEALREQTQPQS